MKFLFLIYKTNYIQKSDVVLRIVHISGTSNLVSRSGVPP